MGELLDQVRGFGLEFSPQQIEKTFALYAPHIVRPTPDVAKVTRDVQYGPDERNRLDIFAPAGGASGAPVLVYVHGGGFVQGDKGAPDAPFYNNVGAWAAKQGWVGITMTYRLAPAHTWPAGSRDVAAAVHWIRDNIAAHGGDRDKLVLMGHSAGGAHVSGYLAHPDLRDEASEYLKGAVLVSGIYDVQHSDQNKFAIAYYGDDETVYPSQSHVPGLGETDVPLMLALAEFDPAEFHRLAAHAVMACANEKGAWPPFHWLAGHNHLSPIAQIGCGEDTLGPLIVDQLTGPRGWLAAR